MLFSIITEKQSKITNGKAFIDTIYIHYFMLKNADRFFKVYAGIPIEERKLAIVIIDEQPFNWNLAYEEINNNTIRGKKILEMLIELKII